MKMNALDRVPEDKKQVYDPDWIVENCDLVKLTAELGWTGDKAVTKHPKECVWRGPCLLCNCPDHFAINEHEKIWHCFSCHRGGDAIQLVKAVMKMTYMQAIRWISNRLSAPQRGG